MWYALFYKMLYNTNEMNRTKMGAYMRKIAILGATGSIGTQALEVIRNHKDLFEVTAMTAGKNIKLFTEQVKEFKPRIIAVSEAEDAKMLQSTFPDIEVLWGLDGLVTVAVEAEGKLLLNALVGMMGMLPTYYAIQSGKDIALANKETLVAGGDVIMKIADQYNAKILPVDSEHSAIFQCLQGNEKKEVESIKLTASGGPFRGYDLEKLKNVSVEDALRHPNWSMGSKITIDSATLMNKGLEVIEAKWLFDLPPEKIEVLVHPQSIIHSMVAYIDGSVIAQMGIPDMKGPIQYAFSYPNRIHNNFQRLDLGKIGSLTFEEPDKKVFKTLQLAYDAIKKGGSYPVVLNAANEILVYLFLEKKISFLDIQNNIIRTMNAHVPKYNISIEEIIEIDKEIRKRVLEKCS